MAAVKLRCRLGLHRWVLLFRVSPPMWDRSARGEMYGCACGKQKAR